MEEEEFLTLRLSIAPAHDHNREGKRKRNIIEISNYSSWSDEEEGKILGLLQMRERMLKADHHNKRQDTDAKGLHLIHSLLIAATSVNEKNATSGVENLRQLYEHVSLRGDSVQRVAAYFADALLAHLLTRKSPFYDAIMKPPSPSEAFSAFTSLYKASPFFQFAHFTANQAILEAFQRDASSRALHVVDFDVSYGFQWPSLMQSLSENATPTNKISLRITAFGPHMEEIQETESRLVSFAKGFCNLVFEFHGLVRGSKNVKVKKRKNETVAVNLVFHLTSLKTLSKISETLSYVHSLKPSVIVLVEQEGKCSSNKFLPRFMESLHQFAAIFDSLDDCLPLDSAERLSIERDHLGREIRSVINYDGDDEESCPRFEKMETWSGRMERRGFVGVEQSCRAVMQAKLLLKIRSHCCPIKFDGENGGFRVFERENGKAISLGWQDRILITASSWCSAVS
ncbi:GRAS family protein RAM1-like [Salvia miltiorrhiza]|uniref:GRAS family protein RAM1-like n=1 Tax=Salvia miltiorrhiza TaxID=226208 RepID=UPI0025AD7552|nr:GRAS family protein RAM1-like [Salvia miltiorrhiza]